MCHGFVRTASFWRLLLWIDEDLAAQVRVEGCSVCGGSLHSARYRRKPRGVARGVLGEAGERRLSFCCARDGCRRRHTPASVRFVGRRVYPGAVLVLVTALAAGLSGKRVAVLRARFGVSARTLRRWQRWWREAFAASALWKRLRGHLAAPVRVASLPGSLLALCEAEDDVGRLVQVLRLLSPLGSSSCLREGG